MTLAVATANGTYTEVVWHMTHHHNGWGEYVYTYEAINEYEFLAESELTKVAMRLTESALKEDWENEDDAHWDSFLSK